MDENRNTNQGLQGKQQGTFTLAPRVTPEAVGLDTSRLSRIHHHIERRIREQNIAGAVSIVARDNQVVHWDVQGYADIESGSPLKENGIFRLASMTKPVIGVAVLILAEEGRISIDDPLSKYIPEYQNMKVALPDPGISASGHQSDPNTSTEEILPSIPPYKTVPADREITIRDLLSHSSGLGQGEVGLTEMARRMPKADDTLASLIPLWASVPLDFQPGTQTGYSPMAGFDILGRVVEIASAMPLDRYLSEYIFKPLGMWDTTFVPSEAQWQRVVTLYNSTSQGLVRSLNQRPFFYPRYFCGAGGLHGTPEDYFRFALMLANGGELNGTRILSPRMVQLMRSPQLDERTPGLSKGQNWGLSVRVITDGSASGAPLTTGSFGWSGAWGTHFWIDPEENLVALLMINLENAGGAGAETAREFEMAVMQSIMELRFKG